MKLFKNVDLSDLDKIMTEGILPISVTGNNNWDSNKRADNSIELVYLAKPLTEVNSFTNYGIALLEVDVEADLTSLPQGDQNIGLYEEYTTSRVEASEITNIYVPSLFMSKVEELGLTSFSKIHFVEMKATCFVDMIEVNADEEYLAQFAKTVKSINAASDWMYFRGQQPSREVMDLYNVQYVF